jgi:hypothetical protein
LSKIVVVIWCFVVLVLVQSYTASFSSILTVKRFKPSVTYLDQLLNNGDYVGYQEGSFVNSFLTRRGFGERRLRSYTKKQEYAEALRKGSKNGGVSAIVDEIPYLTAIVSDPHYQKEFQMLKRIYKTPGFGFVSLLLYCFTEFTHHPFKSYATFWTKFSGLTGMIMFFFFFGSPSGVSSWFSTGA